MPADDHDALLARAQPWGNPAGAHNRDQVVIDLAAAVRDLRADYLAALDVIARLTTGWDCLGTDPRHPHNHVWYRDHVLADETESTGPDTMSDREWRVFCDAAQRATRNTT